MRASTDERVLELERKVMGLQHEVQSAQAREALSSGRLQSRLARVESGAQSGDNTFPVVFLDGTYPATTGSHSPTWTPRQTTSRAVVHNLADTLPPVGTVLLCSHWGQRWWCDWSTGSGGSGPTPSVGANILYNPHWYYYGGASHGTLASNENNITCVPDSGHAAYYCVFQSKVGPDIGLSLNTTTPANNISLSDAANYSFDLRLDVLQRFTLPSYGYTLPAREWFYPAYVFMDAGAEANRLPSWPFTEGTMFEMSMSTATHHADSIATEAAGETYTIRAGSYYNAHGHFHDNYNAATSNMSIRVGRDETQHNTDPLGIDPIPEFGCGFYFPTMIVTRYET